jgi:hypothetical protein
VRAAQQLLGLWPDTDEEAETVTQLSYSGAVEWMLSQDSQKWYVASPTVLRCWFAGTQVLLRFWKSVPGPLLTPSRWRFVQRMLAVDPEERLDAASSLAEFVVHWWARSADAV